jgi:beta-lactamase class A
MIASDSLQLLRAKTLARLQEIAGSTRGVIGLFVLDPLSGETFAVNEDVPFPQASAVKIPVLMEVYKQAGEGRFKLSDEHCITREEKVAGGGVLAHLGDGTVRMSLHDLCVLMIMVRDNTATNILIDLVGIENVNRTLESLGLRHTRLCRLFRLSQSTGHGTYIAPAERKAIG